ncbi:hypothetical protein ENUP19_0047G0213 [Entamoeba nuttalli]|uniref:tRNA-uridine aminocarboxypropyltransferase 1 n=2 Tax=Entamoeba nuttalli TaxID=412467 RepID=K2HPR0_ENTNP|nr:DTW domain containing protein [Entamoeba nuttalli P19]EKE37895.1 DTW domain containing protein [Entamoeba nuttalli P19]|eukprot:XP_008859779.1 DTW domain containing protein [Entamoeba nuttalli P19]
METDLINNLKLSSYDVLETIDKNNERIECPQCHKHMKYYCYNCRKQLLPTPIIKLPITLDIVMHPKEKPSKSTALAATILAPEDTHWIVFPEVPKYNEKTTLLLFPSPDAQPLDKIEHLEQYKTIVCIESVWQKANQVANSPNLCNLKKVIIQSKETIFWRYQHCGKTNLATIEAIYYFYREWYDAMKWDYSNQVDDLLYFYCYTYQKIQEHYKKHPELQFIHIDGYIHYDEKKK